LLGASGADVCGERVGWFVFVWHLAATVRTIINGEVNLWTSSPSPARVSLFAP
jgi:hypothetical protein